MYDGIAMAGGNKQMIACLGCLNWLEANGFLDLSRVHCFSGVSSGSIGVALLACGIGIVKCVEELLSIDEDYSPGNFIKHWGFYDIKDLIRPIRDIILKYRGHIPTFGELYRTNGKFLNITVSNLTQGAPENFNPDTTPDLDIMTAVEISCSIPFVFGKYVRGGVYYCDGGLFKNVNIESIYGKCKKMAILKLGMNGHFDSLIGYVSHVLGSIVAYNEQIELAKYKDDDKCDIFSVHLERYNGIFINREESIACYSNGFLQMERLMKENLDKRLLTKK